MENDSFKCKCGKALKRNEFDWSNLMVHIRTLHKTTPSGPQNTLDFMRCKKSQTNHDWIEWKCVELRPSSFVESEYVKVRVKLEVISWILCKVHAMYMHTIRKWKKKSSKPEKLALIVDGRTSAPTTRCNGIALRHGSNC